MPLPDLRERGKRVQVSRLSGISLSRVQLRIPIWSPGCCHCLSGEFVHFAGIMVRHFGGGMSGNRLCSLNAELLSDASTVGVPQPMRRPPFDTFLFTDTSNCPAVRRSDDVEKRFVLIGREVFLEDQFCLRAEMEDSALAVVYTLVIAKLSFPDVAGPINNPSCQHQQFARPRASQQLQVD